MKRSTTLTLLLLFALGFIAGCGSEKEPAAESGPEIGTATPAHDPHDIPLTEAEKEALRQEATDYANALTQIKSYRDAIRDAIAAGNPPQAHRPLDELDVVLEHLPSSARESSIPRTDWETVNTSAQELRESFNKVHAQIDAGEKPDYQTVSGDVDAAIARLDGVSSANQP